MKVNEVVNRVRMEATTHGVDEQISQTKALVNAQGELVRSSDVLTKTTDTSAKKALSVQKAFDMQERRLIGLARAQFEFDKVKKTSDAALEQFPAMQGRINTVMAEATMRLNQAKEAAERNAIAQQKAAQSMVIPDRVVTMHEAVANAMKKTREELVPLFGIGQRYKEQVEAVRTAVAGRAVSEKEGAAAIQRYRAAAHEQVETFKKVTEAQGKYINGTGLARHELINLSRQAQDVGVSLMSGQGFATVLMQQGSQIADIFISTGATMKSFWGQVAAGAAFIARPLIAVTGTLATIGTAAVVAGVQWASGQNDVQRALLGIGKASGATLDDINKIAAGAASALGLSRGEARDFATELARTGRIGVAEMAELTGLGKDLSRVLGVDLADAAKMVAQAMTSPKGAQELNQRLGFMDAGMQRQVESLFAQNKLMEAQQVLAGGIQKSLEGVNKTVGIGSKIWTSTTNFIANEWDAIGQIINRAAGNVGMEEQLGNAQKRLEQLGQTFAAIPAGLQGTAFTKTLEHDIENTQKQIAKLNAEMKKSAEISALTKLNLESTFAADVVKTVLPDIKGMQSARDAADAVLKIFNDIQASGGGDSPLLKLLEKAGIGLREITLAFQVANEAQKQFQDQSGQQERRTGKREEVREEFKGTGISADVGIQLKLMQDQLAVAQALTGQERMRAQEIATTTRLLFDGKTIQEATAVAAKERAIAQAEINSQAQMMIAGLNDQLAVSSAVTGEARMGAQEIATRNKLIQQGVDSELAAAAAALEHANAQAQIKSQAQGTLVGLQNQFAVSSSITNAGRIMAQEAATYNGLIQQGVDSATAGAIASQQRANSEAQASAQVAQGTRAIEDQTKLIDARLKGTEATVRAQLEYNNAIEAGASEAEAAARKEAVAANERAKGRERAAQAEERYAEARAKANAEEAKADYIKGFTPSDFGTGSKRWMTASGKSSQFNPAGYQFIINLPTGWGGAGLEGLTSLGKTTLGGGGFGGVADIMVPSAKGWENIIDNQLKFDGNISSTINKLFEFTKGPQNAMMADQIGAILRLTDLLPEKDQIPEIERILKMTQAQSGPMTIARMELIKELTDKLEQLKNSTENLDDSMNEILSPFYTQDPRTSHLGYRAGSDVYRPDRVLGPGELGGPMTGPPSTALPKVEPLPSNPTMPHLQTGTVVPPGGVGPNTGWGRVNTETAINPYGTGQGGGYLAKHGYGEDQTTGEKLTGSSITSPKDVYYDAQGRRIMTMQGMANGGSVTVPGGYSAVDNFLLPVRSGERINVNTPEESKEPKVVIHAPITINMAPGNDKQGARETAFQTQQAIRRVLAG